MNWKEMCVSALNAEKMFEDANHRTRFKELVDCFGNYPFFTKGVCKCVYMSAWDEEHFCIMLETLTDLSLAREKDTTEMSNKGDSMAEEQTGEEYYLFQLSVSLLNDLPFVYPDHITFSPENSYLIRRVLQAAEIIDSL